MKPHCWRVFPYKELSFQQVWVLKLEKKIAGLGGPNHAANHRAGHSPAERDWSDLESQWDPIERRASPRRQCRRRGRKKATKAPETLTYGPCARGRHYRTEASA